MIPKSFAAPAHRVIPTALSLCLLSLGSATNNLSAGQIQWQSSVNLYPGSTSDSFINNWSANSVLAYNATTVAGVTANPSITLNGVTFTSVAPTTLTSGYTAASGVRIQAAASNSEASAYDDGAFTRNGNIYNVIASGHSSLNTFTISGLTPGTGYQIQVITNDSGGGSSTDRVGFSDGTQSHANSIIAGTAGISKLKNGDTADDVGDSIVGTFTADAVTQSFAIRGSADGGVNWNNGEQAVVNALQIAEVPGPLAITVGNTLKQQMRYGVDMERLWFWTGNAGLRRKYAEWLVADTDVDYVRVAMNSKYELVEGTFQEDAYFDEDDSQGGGTSNDRIIPMMRDMQGANPDIKFFASPRPLNEAVSGVSWQPYPQWVTGSTGNSGNFDFKWEKCSEYLVRYLLLMKHYGFKISYMDVSNEWQSNGDGGGRVSPEDLERIYNYLNVTYMSNPWEHPDFPGLTLVPSDIPELIGVSAWSYTPRTSSGLGISTSGDRNAISIAGVHNTDKDGTAQDFMDDAQ